MWQDGGHSVTNLLAVSGLALPHEGRPKAIKIPNFDQISQSAAEKLLLLFSENKRSPSWNSTSGFGFDSFTAICFTIGLSNFITIGLSAAEVWRHSDFQDGDRQPCWIWFRAMVGYPRSASGGLCFIFKFRLARIYSLGDREIFIFWHFGLKLSIFTLTFRRFWEYIFPNWRHLSL